MDSNNGKSHIGIGEREGRIFSSIVHDRNYGLVHGMGRSGNVNELQPKAVGSSLLVQLCKSMTKNLLNSIGLSFVSDVLLLPFATGMALTISLLTLHSQKPNTKYVIWPRIDQKTCFKCIFTSNLIPVPIQPIVQNEELNTNIEEIKRQIDILGKENILCIMSTTSGFAPRGYDNVIEISSICKTNEIYHVINNAYGIYCTKICDMLSQADKKGRIDLIVSSTDKNFMVPVGGALIYSSNEKLIDAIKENYPGRASLAPLVDLFISYLQMGKNKYKDLIKDRKEKYALLKEKISQIALKYNERVLDIPNNKISIAMTIGSICSKALSKRDITELGSLFYSRQISGIRIVTKSNPITINGFKFSNYGSSCENYPNLPYMAFACAIGVTSDEINSFIVKLPKIIDEYLIEHIQNKEITQITQQQKEHQQDEIKAKDKEKTLTAISNQKTNYSICSNYNFFI